MSSHTYAKTDANAVILNTPMSTIMRVSPFGMPRTHTAVMTSRLNAAEPTMVDRPSSPATKLPSRISYTESRISGAASRRHEREVRDGRVQILTVTWLVEPSGFLVFTIFSADVMTSIAAMNTSAMMPTARNDQISPMK